VRSTEKRKSLYLKFLFAVVEGLLDREREVQEVRALEDAESFYERVRPVTGGSSTSRSALQVTPARMAPTIAETGVSEVSASTLWAVDACGQAPRTRATRHADSFAGLLLAICKGGSSLVRYACGSWCCSRT